ncbi:carboxylesterase/lipase family protein [Phenylobacterium sp.]|jgi:para-nitrobenzyl esterase|uniref:carboxylesterase/lipase family protein n=1 Tax=Phenylobacterium sp. TaxID=1871053 RepID=UPI002E318902|nr:carboxylesterase family protein [Phenylobacterium sp.]HEX3366839.1 carboxylesterase family protein [Phenylobacterium sp.]
MSLRAALTGVVLSLGVPGAAFAQERPVVMTASGPVKGVSEGGEVMFKGMPFAAPPVGPLRWKPPAPPAAWTSPRDASDFSGICVQPSRPDGVLAAGAGRPQSEDCLYLNVFAPTAAKAAPVMVWIHGGAHRFGSGIGPVYDGAAFARDGVVLVTLNYRLGALGYFAHPGLTRAAKPGEPLANYGAMDQMAALAWVRKNIAAFGGDPKNVTVFGESAGGQSILALLATPAAKGLFDKAVVESGGGWNPAVSLAQEEARGVARMQRAANLGPEATADQLRAVPADKLLDSVGGAAGVGPVEDGRLMKETAAQAFADGHAIDVPLIIGSNSFEASLMRNFPVDVKVALGRMTPAQKAAYGDLGSDQNLAEALYTDTVMAGPARWIAGKASTGAPSFLYHFSYVAAAQRGKVPGASHGSEIVYVFETGGKVAARAITPQDQAVSSLMHSCWVGFAKTGKPACNSGPAWPAYDPASDHLMEFGVDSGVRTNFRKVQLDADQAAAGH